MAEAVAVEPTYVVSMLYLLLAVLIGSARAQDVPPTVPELDLQRYQGTWYELASFPMWFQRGCHATTATYTLLPGKQVEVVNRCRRWSLDGRESEAVGRARQPDPDDPGKLEVSFFRPFWADYWVVGLDPGYQWAIVGSPERDRLWLLSRTPHVAPELYDELVSRAAALGFDTSLLQKTVQPPASPE
jgi:apolipoprotein D and lipocalin family protein